MSVARPLQRLIAQAAQLGADTLEVEYRDGYEEVSVLKGGWGLSSHASPVWDGAPGHSARSSGSWSDE